MKQKKLVLIVVALVFVTGCMTSEKHYEEWVVEGSKTYYFDEKGEMKRGWFLNGENKWFYFAKDGHMIENERKEIEGVTYYFDKDGVMVSDKQQEINGRVYYYLSNGAECKGMWIKRNYVDEFGDATERSYVTNKERFKGKVSTITAKNLGCEYEILIDDKNVALIVHEKRSGNEGKVKDFLDITNKILGHTKTYRCKVKTDKGTEIEFKGYQNGERIYFDDIAKRFIIDTLKDEQGLKMILYEQTEYTSLGYEYFVNVEADNFKFVYWK